MKRLILTTFIILLIFFTAFIKNYTKKLDASIYETRENLSYLKDKYELHKLEYNYLTSPEKLMNYQSIYFDDELKPIDISLIGQVIIKNDYVIFKKLDKFSNEN